MSGAPSSVAARAAEGETVGLGESFDAAIVLASGPWRAEEDSARCVFARWIARTLPVIYVQADLDTGDCVVEPSEIDSVQIAHVHVESGRDRAIALRDALRARGIAHPLLWIENHEFAHVFDTISSTLRIHYAAVDYFQRGAPQIPISDYVALLNRCDLLLAATENLRDSIVTHAHYQGNVIVLPGDCETGRWIETAIPTSPEKLALYTGGVHGALDLDLLAAIARQRPDWTFAVAGPLWQTSDAWDKLTARSNVRYLGELSAQELREWAARASAGIVPIRKQAALTRSHRPTEAIAMTAMGLPVVTTPLLSLARFGKTICQASGAAEFAARLDETPALRNCDRALSERHLLSQSQDAHRQWDTLRGMLTRAPIGRDPKPGALRILVLYDYQSTFTSTVREHIESFGRFSRHSIWYATGTREAQMTTPIDMFDVVILHYSIRLSLTWQLNAEYAAALAGFRGYKVLFVQDEYETTETLRSWISKLGFDLVFTCVPENGRELVYPKSRFPDVEFIQNLTGYVPDRLESLTPSTPVTERETLIGYRGRALPYWYGQLGQDKHRIGVDMRRICEQRNLPVDIEWEAEKRIYGNQWYEWLASCRATLGTESGANVFDDDGSLRDRIQKALTMDPDLTYADAHARFIGNREGLVRMNQVSPRVFEAIACRTALILFEGEYSGVLEPHTHYLPLAHDYSNVDEVLQKVQDDEHLRALVDRAHRDIIQTGRWNYRQFISEVDGILDARVRRAPARPAPVSMIVGTQGPYSDRVQPEFLRTDFCLGHTILSAVLEPLDLRERFSTESLAPPPALPAISPPAARHPVLAFKIAVADRLQNYPRTLKAMTWSYGTVAGTFRWSARALHRMLRCGRAPSRAS